MATYIGMTELHRGLNIILQNNFPSIARLAEEQRNNFTPPAFYSHFIILEDESFALTEHLSVTVVIDYIVETHRTQDLIFMLDKLRKIFRTNFKVGDRALPIFNRKHNILQNILTFQFDIEFTQAIPCDDLDMGDREHLDFMRVLHDRYKIINGTRKYKWKEDQTVEEVERK